MKKKDIKNVLFFIGPGLIGIVIFYIIPFLIAFYYSLINNITEKQFTGIDNYIELFTNRLFLKAALNTLVLTFTSVPAIFLLSLGAALILDRKCYKKDFFLFLFISPLVVPVASIVFIWNILFNYNGVMNSLLSHFQLAPVDWMNTGWSRFVVVLFYLIKNTGFNVVIFLAGLQSIPGEYYEAAMIDGAGAWKQFTHITFVFLYRTSVFVLIISIINSFKIFREVFLISTGYPYAAIYTIQHYMNNLFNYLDYQKLASIAFTFVFLIFLLSLGIFKLEKKSQDI